MSEIQQFYNDQSIFVTGGTGFMGKILIEKLLRSCPKIKAIYVLIRPVKEKQIEDRLKEMTNLPIFEPLRQMHPNFEEKIIPLAGDIQKPNLGLSPEDTMLIMKEVSIVFHAAASTRFDEPLKNALKVNVDSVKIVIDICKGCKNLKALVYVSTAFSNCIYEHVEEKAYPARLSHEKLTELVDVIDYLNMPKYEEKKFTKYVIGKFPNTYCFTKSIAEEVVSKSAKDLPVSIFRFSIGMATLKEPIPGWVDALQGISMIFLRIGLGLIRVIHVKRHANMEIVPSDLACNCLIASAWETSISKNNKQEDLRVYNYVSGTDNPVSWDYLQYYLRKERNDVSTKQVLYFPDSMIIESVKLFLLLHYILHFIPAVLGDVFLRILGRKPMFYKMFKKGTKLEFSLRFFTNGQWVFDTDNVKSLWKKLSENDKKLYNFDITSFNWGELLLIHCVGGRKYILKEENSEEIREKVRIKIRKLYYIHQVVRGIFYTFILWIFWKIYCLIFNGL